ncbi:MAG TPA: hypothetical protein VKA70_08695 [Blastocatellia bacterium]|nr:hypothetical protein [Blastocatellia bacterium]
MNSARGTALGICCALAFSLCLAASPTAIAQSSTGSDATKSNVLGEVLSIDQAAKRLVVKTEGAQPVTVLFNETTVHLRVPPGEQTLDKAVKVAPAEIGVGDRVYARGKADEEKKTVTARQLIIMTKADIQLKQSREREEWQRRSIAGVVTSLDPQTKEVKLQSLGQGKNGPPIVVPCEGAVFRRYAPDSVRFSDAKPSSFAELRVGDQLRVLGDKNEDGRRFIPKEIVSGAFKTVGGTVTQVDAATGEIKINLLGGRQQLSIALNKRSALRRITPQSAQLFIRQDQTVAAAKPDARPEAKRPADLQEVLDKLPSLTIADIKQGDVVMVSSSVGSDPSRMTAIALFAGLDSVINLLQKQRQQSNNTPSPATGLPGGVLGFVIGLP